MTEDTSQQDSAHTGLIDIQRSVCLCGQGLPNHLLAVVVEPDGTESYWIAHWDDPDPDHGNADPRHEKLGRLPKFIRDKIWGDQLLCGRPRFDGRPCRRRVAMPSQDCGQHGRQP